MLKLTKNPAAQTAARADRLNLLICGAQRSGTTSLKHDLARHPEIGFLGESDLAVDDRTVDFPFVSPINAVAARGEDGNVYRKIAQRLAGKKSYIGTKQPYLMCHPHVPFNLSAHLPAAKLIFILRHPVDAMYSTYRRGFDRGPRTESFEELIQLSIEAGRRAADPEERGSWAHLFDDPEAVPFLVDRGFYWIQIRRFFQCFPREQMRFLRFDEYVGDRARVLAQTLDFLGLDPSFEFSAEPEVRNASGAEVRDMNPDTRAKLVALYRESNRTLLEELDWPLDLWDA